MNAEPALLDAASAVGNQAGLRIPVGIFGTGLYVPSQVVTNDDLAVGLDTSDAWIRSRTGIATRHFVADGQTTSDMCVAAASAALDSALLRSDQVDAVILATTSPDRPLPSTAVAVAGRLGAQRAIPVDLTQVACAGGVYGLWLACHMLQNDGIRHVLVIGGESLSRRTDPRDRGTRVFFGDAAAAVVVGRTAPGYGLLSWHLGAAPSNCVAIAAGGASQPVAEQAIAAGDHFVRMDGKAVWQAVIRFMPASIRAAVAAAGLGMADIAHFALHQPNAKLVHAVLDRLGVAPGLATITVDRLGNTGAASTFTALHDAFRLGRINSDDIFVVAGIGAGLLWGSLCLRQHSQREWAGPRSGAPC